VNPRPSLNLEETLKTLAASPVPVAEAYFDEKTGNVTRLVLAPRLRVPEPQERDVTPRIAGKHKRTAIDSLGLADPAMSKEPEPE
jgi:hypothetical protein